MTMKTFLQQKFLRWTELTLIAILLFVHLSLADSGGLSHIPGAFVDVGLGARPMGLAGAAAVLTRDADAILYNPAGLTSLTGPQARFSMTRQFSLIPYDMLLYGQKGPAATAFGVGFLTTGDEALRENTVLLSVAHSLPWRLSGGFTLKYRSCSFGNNADGIWNWQGGNRQVHGSGRGYGIDLGLRTVIGKRLAIAAVWKDAFGKVNYDASNGIGSAEGGSEAVPPGLILGLGFFPARNFSVEVNLKKSLYADTANRLMFGGEKTLFSFLTVRGGYAQDLDASTKNRLYSVGGGLFHRFSSLPFDFSFDFAYLFHELQNFSHLSFGIAWRK